MALNFSSERSATAATDIPKPARTRSKARSRAIWLFGAALAAALLAGCSASWSSDQGKTISPKGSGYSYKVPHGWLIENGSAYKVEGRSFQTAVRGQTGLAIVAVSEQSIKEKITSSNLNAIELGYKSAAAKWQYPPTGWQKTSLAGAPALSYHRSGMIGGETREIDAYVGFKVHRVFFVECIYTPDTQSDVVKACSSVTKSLAIH